MLYPSSERLCASVATAATGVATGAVLRFAALLSSCPAPWLWDRERLWTPCEAPWTLSPPRCSAVTFSCVGENVSRLMPNFAAIFRVA